MADLAGQTIGKYKVRSLIGQGGMASVYLADDDTGAQVALKVLEEGPGIAGETLERFHREVQASKALREHPNILTVFDSGTDGSQHYIAMQYIEGHRGYSTVAGMQEKDPPEVKQVLDLGIKMASALEFAHSKGLVHRDVTPKNILIDRFAVPQLADFGLVRIEGKGNLTMSGRGMGTPYYMSPEQVEGNDDLDGRTDIYSLGVVLYELLSDGDLPYITTSSMAVFRDILEGLVRPLRSVNNDISLDVEAVVMKCLAKSRDARHQSAGELAQDLDRCLKGDGAKASEKVETQPAPGRKKDLKFRRKAGRRWRAKKRSGLSVAVRNKIGIAMKRRWAIYRAIKAKRVKAIMKARKHRAAKKGTPVSSNRSA